MKRCYGLVAAIPLLFAVQAATANTVTVPDRNQQLLSNPSQERMQQQQQTNSQIQQQKLQQDLRNNQQQQQLRLRSQIQSNQQRLQTQQLNRPGQPLQQN
ncbi:MAG: DUF2756 domain-containing protein [Ewingella americana]|jgi:uncharacterized membrane protein YhiD involved in acid resistance|uniref:Outer membrane protein n=2 Tax=Ewingella americana TaxID=41202 RepID=A0A085G3H2_EWIA3|nr:DUF2756 domain-containing protein [Ewingella americana]KAA8725676.1 DUF2756 domain-containing protein [Ewingella americana]KFC78267.1 hypothetical protein GEAM_3876 [Ewingella americana ATCC 33852]MCI1680633.1 DUF2756 domain-containing protein [Ewingella americana]MCI1856438.1 DUF2756 domain-containing protein [Ewingella americana]MCI1864044.1 DUF2756 domain-containing protein [Ewingella americana]